MNAVHPFTVGLVVPCLVPQYHGNAPSVACVPVTSGLNVPTPNACANCVWSAPRPKPSKSWNWNPVTVHSGEYSLLVAAFVSAVTIADSANNTTLFTPDDFSRAIIV